MGYYETFWTNPEYRGRDYGYWDPDVYTLGYHRGQDFRYNGQTLTIPALAAGTVVALYFSIATGTTVVIDTGRARGRYHAYSHVFKDTAMQVGHSAKAGWTIGRFANKWERPGSAWLGPHLHFTVGDSIYVATNMLVDEYDPREIIREVFAESAGGGGSTPFPPPIPEPESYLGEEEEMARIKYVDGARKARFYLAGINDAEQISKEEAAAWNKAVGADKADEKFQDLTGKEFRLVIDGVKRRRTRWFKAQAAAVGAQVQPNFAAINADLDALLAGVEDTAVLVQEQE